MCRLYGLRANAPTRVECALIHSQNALMVQSRQDATGISHMHGWGIASYEAAGPRLERKAWAAYDGEHFRRAAAQVCSKTALAHVRRATVGAALLENTHPFMHGGFSFAHNGTVPAFEEVRGRMLDAMSSDHRDAIAGDTDSEHLFHLILSERQASPGGSLADAVRRAVRLVLGWCDEAAPRSRISFNIMITDGDSFVGTRIGRGLHVLERRGAHRCDACGSTHVAVGAASGYRAIEIASEPLTAEPWRELPDRVVYRFDDAFDLHVESLA